MGYDGHVPFDSFIEFEGLNGLKNSLLESIEMYYEHVDRG